MKMLFLLLLLCFSLLGFAQQTDAQHKYKAEDSVQKTKFNFSSILDKEIELEEVFVSKSKFDAVSLGIIPKEIKRLSINERRLYTAGDFKWIDLLGILGGTLPVDPIINKISGRTKRLKKYIQVEKNISHFNFLNDHYRTYMLENLNIQESLIPVFVDFLVGQEKVRELIDLHLEGELLFLMGDEWLKFQAFQEDD